MLWHYKCQFTVSRHTSWECSELNRLVLYWHWLHLVWFPPLANVLHWWNWSNKTEELRVKVYINVFTCFEIWYFLINLRTTLWFNWRYWIVTRHYNIHSTEFNDQCCYYSTEMSSKWCLWHSQLYYNKHYPGKINLLHFEETKYVDMFITWISHYHYYSKYNVWVSNAAYWIVLESSIQWCWNNINHNCLEC
jgi:hypothetical protein